MRSKIAKRISDKTSQHTKNMVNQMVDLYLARVNYLKQTNELPQLFGKDFIHLRLQANKTRFYNPEAPSKRV
jgi:hypothetical protein